MNLKDEVTRRAFELAKSGRHIDCITIENQLAEEGFPDAFVALQDPELRATLRAICYEHWDIRSISSRRERHELR